MISYPPIISVEIQVITNTYIPTPAKLTYILLRALGHDAQEIVFSINDFYFTFGVSRPTLYRHLSYLAASAVLEYDSPGNRKGFIHVTFLLEPFPEVESPSIETAGLNNQTMRPTIFKVYEENIGPLTPLIADQLIDAENEYSASWITEAIQIAVEYNKRSWAYCLAILERWYTQGKTTSPAKAPKPAGRDESYVDRRLRELGESRG
jgi:DnaD/phage-associated family protein